MSMHASLSSPLAAKPINNLSAVSRPRRKAVSVRNSVQTACFMSSCATDSKRAVAGSLYEILRVERTASLNEIKTAYRSLAKVYHPDAMGSSSDGSDFIEIQNAYATLSDPKARAMYDMSLSLRVPPRRVGPLLYPTRRWETDQCW